MSDDHERAVQPPASGEQLPPKQKTYPTFVTTEADRNRWDLAMAVAARLLEEPMGSAHTRSAAVVLFHGPIPTA